MAPRKQMLMSMLAQDPADPFLHYALALEFIKENNIGEATSALEHIVATFPHYLGSYYQLGKLYEQQEQFEQASRVYQTGIALAQQQGHKKTLTELKGALAGITQVEPD
jgi:Flp pilus assembly protein TadD